MLPRQQNKLNKEESPHRFLINKQANESKSNVLITKLLSFKALLLFTLVVGASLCFTSHYFNQSITKMDQTNRQMLVFGKIGRSAVRVSRAINVQFYEWKNKINQKLDERKIKKSGKYDGRDGDNNIKLKDGRKIYWYKVTGVQKSGSNMLQIGHYFADGVYKEFQTKVTFQTREQADDVYKEIFFELAVPEENHYDINQELYGDASDVHQAGTTLDMYDDDDCEADGEV